MSMELVLISGMSGSGKSVALHALEDAGYYCVDNLPPELLQAFVELKLSQSNDKVAIAMDARSAQGLPQLPEQLEHLCSALGIQPHLIFLDASTSTLIRRFSETRRRHPLSPGPSVSERQALVQDIDKERELLGALRDRSTVIDTSDLKSAQLQSYIKQTIQAPESQMTLMFQSFGFKHRMPTDSDYVFDVRMLPNPHYEKDLRPLTGLDEPVASYLRNLPEVQQMQQDIQQFLERWLPLLAKDHRSYVTIGIGCTGGQHRSVYLVEALARHFEKTWPTVRRHRSLDFRGHFMQVSQQFLAAPAAG
ncbi:RNase adapter RapZ [Comamonas resistens]|uniref:RNase adapter RapZ n=1 Tax=Comamonas resistens TaxID=3046670 RepID=A0ABY8STI3_9BURK|nr:RNase adapter RapZ [Comamonas resistens]MDL5036291.1 RNase adapter RapZ [Comamonas resistens]WHS66377.1 RNase adapter RapZ [Comamonas resistens]